MSELTKIVKVSAEPDEMTRKVARALFDLENASQDLKQDLKQIKIHEAREVMEQGRKAIVVFVPQPQMHQLSKIQQRLIRELEKKFTERHVVFVPLLRIISQKEKLGKNQKRPRSRTATVVHSKLMEHVVYPSEVVGKRTLIRPDGSTTIFIQLDKRDATFVEHKLESFSLVLKHLTSKNVSFEFPAY